VLSEWKDEVSGCSIDASEQAAYLLEVVEDDVDGLDVSVCDSTNHSTNLPEPSLFVHSSWLITTFVDIARGFECVAFRSV
jgi:hypothetical protein